MEDPPLRLLIQDGCPFCALALDALKKHFPGQFSLGNILEEADAAGDFDMWARNDHLPLLFVREGGRVIQGAGVAKFVKMLSAKQEETAIEG